MRIKQLKNAILRVCGSNGFIGNWTTSTPNLYYIIVGNKLNITVNHCYVITAYNISFALSSILIRPHIITGTNIALVKGRTNWKMIINDPDKLVNTALVGKVHSFISTILSQSPCCSLQNIRVLQQSVHTIKLIVLDWSKPSANYI